MSELGEDFKAMNKRKQARHKQMKEYNIKILSASGLEYTMASPECFLFRDGTRKCDFYPSTGRWKEIGTNKMFKGGAGLLLTWLNEDGE